MEDVGVYFGKKKKNERIHGLKGQSRVHDSMNSLLLLEVIFRWRIDTKWVVVFRTNIPTIKKRVTKLT